LERPAVQFPKYVGPNQVARDYEENINAGVASSQIGRKGMEGYNTDYRDSAKAIYVSSILHGKGRAHIKKEGVQ
jgi:hypothetical protein